MFYEVSFSCFSWACSISMNLQYNLAWNAVVMSGLVLLAASWNCFLIGFSVCFNLFVLLFLVNPCLSMAFQLCMEWIPIRKKLLNWFVINNFHFCVLLLVRNSPQATFAGIIMNNKWEWKTGWDFIPFMNFSKISWCWFVQLICSLDFFWPIDLFL